MTTWFADSFYYLAFCNPVITHIPTRYKRRAANTTDLSPPSLSFWKLATPWRIPPREARSSSC